ncbi:TetR/AcrR family transcriptional regulator [Corynebacterium kutscheri]|uniref:Transcriptional regulator, TetR family n=1 Tax=Corynebacterium kutscheri TaxID=35755 RepID=A0A0F6R0J1_9CORY|nr:TetR/AcrR family transcriptional regulator [Corynebacterium kutscheri]AKE41330.1 transcriptional regulator, TetR family [Corynebacterium kutscheri]VEH09652.1 TetR family transcriptional regulator [Corynebacterium kutscheri]
MRADAFWRRKLIIETTANLLINQGTDFTVELVAKKAGVGTATVYRHFPTRADLLEEALSHVADKTNTLIQKIINDIKTGSISTLNALQVLNHHFPETGINALLPLLIYADFDSLTDKLQKQRKQTITLFHNLIEHFHDSGLVHNSISALSFFNGLMIIHTAQLFYPSDASPEDATSKQVLLTIFLNGCKYGTNPINPPAI